MSNNRVIYMSKEDVEAFSPPPGSALFSISDNQFERAEVDESKWDSVFFHYFIDGGYDEQLIEYSGKKFREDYQSYFMPETGEKIRKELDSVVGKCSLIVVNCKYGRSRSAALAKYISDVYGYSREQDAEEANQTVYRMLHQDGVLMGAIRRTEEVPEEKEKESLLEGVLHRLGL